MFYLSLQQRLENQHTLIQILLSNTDAYRITYHPAPGKWSLHDHIAHMAKYQGEFFKRIELIVLSEAPFFPRYNAEEDTEFELWRTWSSKRLWEKIQHDRKVICQHILALPEEALQRKGLHPTYGNLSLMEWTEFFLLHEAHHLFAMFQLAHNSPERYP